MTMDEYKEVLSLFKEAVSDSKNTHKARAFSLAYNDYIEKSGYTEDDAWLILSLFNDYYDWDVTRLFNRS